MRKYLRLAAFLLPFFVTLKAFAACSGSAGVPFNCTPAVAGPLYNDLVFGGVTSGAQNGQSVRWSWSQVFTGTTLTSPVIINATIDSLNSPLAGAYGGTGVANSGKTITLGGNVLTTGAFTTSGTHNLTFTLTGDTNITLPTSGSIFSNALTNTHIFVGNGSNVATDVAMSGDCTIANTGAVTCAKFIAVVPNYLSGLTLSNDVGTPTTKLDTAAGVAADSTNAQMITIGAFVKSVSGAWTSGTGNNGMGNGLTVANTTWYHVCLAYNGGTPDEWFDTSVSCANKPSGVSGALFRRIGSFKTDGSAHIITFVQNNDVFSWGVPALSASAVTPGNTTANTLTVAVPTGLAVEAISNGNITDATSAGSAILVSSLSVTDTAASANDLTAITGAIAANAAWAYIRTLTNTSAQLRIRMSTTTGTYYFNTMGWVDNRGK